MWDSLRRFWLFDDPRSYGARAILQGTAEGLRAVGKDVRVCPFDPALPDSAARLRQDLQDYHPDVILLANHPSSLFLQQIGLLAAPCLMLVWLFDDPFLMGSETFSSQEIVFAADPAFMEGARARGARHVLFLPVAAPLAKQGEYRAEYDCPVTYVGAVSNTTPMRSQLAPAIAQYLDEIIQKKVEQPQFDFDELLERYPIAEGKRIPFTGQVAYYLYAESNRLYRLQYLQPLVRSGLRLYGNDAWLPQIRGTELEACFQGGIDPFTQYPHLIRSAKININLRSLQKYVVPTQRDFLVPYWGGFMFSSPRLNKMDNWQRHHPHNYFALDQFPWSPEAQSPEEMAEQVRQYEENGSVRQEWIKYAAEKIEGGHTFAHRIEQLGRMLDQAL